MSSLLQRGAEWLTAKLTNAKVAGETVICTRGAQQSDPMPATFGQTMLKLADGLGGTRVEWTDADVMIPAASYILGGTATLPERGDLFVRTKNGATITYEARPYGQDEPCWRWADGDRILLRIHLKEIASA